METGRLLKFTVKMNAWIFQAVDRSTRGVALRLGAMEEIEVTIKEAEKVNMEAGMAGGRHTMIWPRTVPRMDPGGMAMDLGRGRRGMIRRRVEGKIGRTSLDVMPASVGKTAVQNGPIRGIGGIAKETGFPNTVDEEAAAILDYLNALDATKDFVMNRWLRILTCLAASCRQARCKRLKRRRRGTKPNEVKES